jgi:DNA-binding transcriptional ArsR family regulator
MNPPADHDARHGCGLQGSGRPGRRRLLDRLNERNGLTLTELCADMGITRQSVTKHLDVLDAAGVVITLRQGSERLQYLNAAPIHDIADRWIHTYDRARAEALSDLETALEATTPMDQMRVGLACVVGERSARRPAP